MSNSLWGNNTISNSNYTVALFCTGLLQLNVVMAEMLRQGQRHRLKSLSGFRTAEFSVKGARTKSLRTKMQAKILKTVTVRRTRLLRYCSRYRTENKQQTFFINLENEKVKVWQCVETPWRAWHCCSPAKLFIFVCTHHLLTSHGSNDFSIFISLFQNSTYLGFYVLPSISVCTYRMDLTCSSKESFVKLDRAKSQISEFVVVFRYFR